MLREQVVDEDEAADDRRGEQQQAGADQLEQQAFHAGQGRQHLDDAARMSALECVILQRDQHGLHGGDAEQCRGHARRQDMKDDAGRDVGLDHVAGEQHQRDQGQRRQWKETGSDAQ